MTAPRAVLFDYSGTLFHLEPEPAPGADLLTAMAAPGFPTDDFPPQVARDWQVRDLDPEAHRRVHTHVLRSAGVDDAERRYELMRADASWRSYPDAVAALTRLRERGLPVALISNIAWDVRSTFRREGAEHLVNAYVLSYVEGVQKPDPRIFELACERIGVHPADTLMIGDSPADAAAADLGARVAIVPNTPVAQRPGALLAALSEHGIG